MTGMSRSELASKIEWEGGVDAALEYGIKASDLDQDDIDMFKAWASLQELHKPYHDQAMRVMDMLPENWEDDWDEDFGDFDPDEISDYYSEEN